MQYPLKNLVKWVKDGNVVRVQLEVKRSNQSEKLVCTLWKICNILLQLEFQKLIVDSVGDQGTVVGLQENVDGKKIVKLVVNPIES